MRVADRANKLVVFDFDGTLADTWRDIATALNRTLRAAGLPPAEGPDVRFWIGDGVRPLLERARPDSAPDEIDVLFEAFQSHYAQCCLDSTAVYPGVVACLDELSELTLAVVSNKPGVFLDRVLRGLRLEGYFALVVSGDALGVRKPDPGVMRHVLARLPGRFEEVWMVGDSAVDVATGRSAGARTIGCAWGLRGADELRSAGAEFVVEKADEIPRLVLDSA